MTDYINRQAAIDEMRTRQLSANEWYATAKAKDDEEIMVRADSAIACFIECILTLKKMPSADVQPVQHGKWIKAQRKGITSYGDGFAECDKCHEVSYLGWNDRYCRNCGATMDGEQNE